MLLYVQISGIPATTQKHTYDFVVHTSLGLTKIRSPGANQILNFEAEHLSSWACFSFFKISRENRQQVEKI